MCCWRLSSQGGMVLESTAPLLVKNISCRRTFTLVVFEEDAYMYNYTRQVNVCRVSYTSYVTSHDLPRLMNMAMACLSFFSCFSGPVFPESQPVKAWNPMLVTTYHLRQRSIVDVQVPRPRLSSSSLMNSISWCPLPMQCKVHKHQCPQIQPWHICILCQMHDALHAAVS